MAAETRAIGSEPAPSPRRPTILSPEARRLALLLAAEPAAELCCELPPPPGINEWWEPVTIHRKGHTVASMRLSNAATRYKAHAEDVLLRQGLDVVALEDEFRDLWLQLHIVSYIATPMARDADGPLKPLQDLICSLLAVNDARVRYSAGSLRLDLDRPRVQVRIEGYQVWDASGTGGPFYMLRPRDTPSGRRCEAVELTPRRLPTPRPNLAALLITR
ncbi:MAG: hypothetical protein ACRDG4_09965 [Chloroflexota bacterium]